MLYILWDLIKENAIVFVYIYFGINALYAIMPFKSQFKKENEIESKSTNSLNYILGGKELPLIKFRNYHVAWGNRILVIDTLLFYSLMILTQYSYSIYGALFKVKERDILIHPFYSMFKKYIEKKGRTLYKEDTLKIKGKNHEVKYYLNGDIDTYKNGKLHRDDNRPARINVNTNTEEYYLNGAKTTLEFLKDPEKVRKKRIHNNVMNFS